MQKKAPKEYAKKGAGVYFQIFRAKTTRRIYMIRHGQYEDGPKDRDRCLSEKPSLRSITNVTVCFQMLVTFF